MSETLNKAKTDDGILNILVDALVERIKDKLLEQIMETVSKHMRKFDGMEEFVSHAIEEYMRNNNYKIDADDVENLDVFIKETLKEATISIDL